MHWDIPKKFDFVFNVSVHGFLNNSVVFCVILVIKKLARTQGFAKRLLFLLCIPS